MMVYNCYHVDNVIHAVMLSGVENYIQGRDYIVFAADGQWRYLSEQEFSEKYRIIDD